jgi:hypothetical protein
MTKYVPSFGLYRTRVEGPFDVRTSKAGVQLRCNISL